MSRHNLGEKNMITKNKFGRITRINNEFILKRLDNKIFITEKILSNYFISFKVYDLKKDRLVAEFRNVLEGVYSFSYNDALNFAKTLN